MNYDRFFLSSGLAQQGSSSTTTKKSSDRIDTTKYAFNHASDTVSVIGNSITNSSFNGLASFFIE